MEETMKKLMDLFGGNAQVANATTHPHLTGVVDSLSQKAGLRKIPEVHILTGRKMPLAGANPADRNIIFSEGLMQTLGMQSHTAPVTPEVEAVLAHEIGHLKEIGKLMTLKTVPIFAVPAIALAGMYLIDRHAKKSKDEKELVKNIHETDTDALCDAQKKECAPFKEHDESKHSFMKYVFKAAKYLAVAGIGTAAGLYLSGKVSNHFEYKADRISAELTGKPDAMINALKKVGSHAESFANQFAPIIEEMYGHIDSKALRGALRGLQKPLDWAMNQWQSHPSVDARIERLSQMIR